MIRAGDRKDAKLAFDKLIIGPQASVYVLNPQPEKAQEAVDCARSMMIWRRANRP
jgi:hypothetical protein